jgi:DNA-binding transcriptional regulator YdaS (Cro superfamily)
MTEAEVLERVRQAVSEAGSIRAFAKQHGLTPSYVHDVLKGRRAVSERVAAIVGVQRVVTVEWREQEG